MILLTKTDLAEKKHMMKMLLTMMGAMTGLAMIMFLFMRLFPGVFS